MSLHIFEETQDPGPIPTDFASHGDYHMYWRHYFRREVVSFLLNARHSDKLEDGGPSKAPTRTPHWIGYVVVGPGTADGQRAFLYDQPPKVVDNKEAASQANKSLREHDVLYLTEKPITLDRDFKNTITLSYLQQSLLKPGCMLATVMKKASFGKTGLGPVTLEVGEGKHGDLERLAAGSDFVRMNCYYFESLATTIREYKTIKSIEFFRMAPILLNPKACVDPVARQERLEAHADYIKQSLKWYKFPPKQDSEGLAIKMKKYLHRNRKLFNPS